MDLTKPIYRCSRIAVVCLFILFTVSIPKWSYDPPLLGAETAETKGPLASLDGFAVIPGSVAVIEDRYVVALLENVEKDLYAIIMFTADCHSGDCALRDLVAYSIFDAQGEEVRLVGDSLRKGVSESARLA